MSSTIDVEGLRILARMLRAGTADLEYLAHISASELARLGRWTDRSQVVMLFEDRARWATELARDLDSRASGMSDADAQMQSLIGLWGRPPRRGRSTSRLERIAEALEQIEELLKTDGLNLWVVRIGDTEVSDDELREIAIILLSLEPDDVGNLLRRLDSELMAKWLDAMEGSGFDVAWQRTVFTFLAEHGGAAQLSRMVIVSDGETQGHLIDAIIDSANRFQQQVVFQRVAVAVSDNPDLAVAAVELFSGMTPASRESSLERLHRTGTFDPFVRALVVEEQRTVQSGWLFSSSLTFISRYDTAPLIGFIEAVSEISDPDLKADVFVAAVRTLKDPLELASENVETHGPVNVLETHRFDDGSGKAALDALVHLLLSDTLGVFDSLRLDSDYLGNTTAMFITELLRAPGARGSIHGEPISHDGAIAVNQILAVLLGGDLDPAARATFFQARERTAGGEIDYVNASRLGFFAGVVSRGLDELGAPRDEEWTAMGIILGGVKFVDPTRVTSAIGFVESSLTAIADEIERRNLDTLMATYNELESALIDEILPREDNYIFDGDAADEFLDKYDFIGGDVGPR